MKTILLKKDDVQTLTFEETYEKHRKWIDGIVSNTFVVGFEFEDLRQIALVAFWRAYKDYNYEKKPVMFAYFAEKYIKNKIKHCYKYSNQKKRKGQAFSLNEFVTEDVEYVDALEVNKDYEKEAINKAEIKTWWDKLTKLQKMCVKYLYEGYTLTDISKMLKKPRYLVDYNILCAQKKYKGGIIN